MLWFSVRHHVTVVMGRNSRGVVTALQGKNVLRKEPMSKDISETDVFLFNNAFHSKFYRVKIGTVSAQKETEPEKQETRQKASPVPHLVYPLPLKHGPSWGLPLCQRGPS